MLTIFSIPDATQLLFMLNTTYFDHHDSGTFRNFCGPVKLHKDLTTLCGLIVGIQTNEHINETEIDMLRSWVNSLGTLKPKAPYYKLIDKINSILEDGIVTDEEAEDLTWLCRSYLDYNTNPYCEVITSATQQPNGFLSGISADHSINIEESTVLGNCSSKNAALFNTWPFNALLPAVNKPNTDKQLIAAERSELDPLCNSVSSIKHKTKPNIPPVQLQNGHFSILIQNSTFCFTGESLNFTRKELAQLIEMYGGVAAASVTAKLHYLVICDVPNPAWAFQMYGRKVEKAMSLKSKGALLEVVFEKDVVAALKAFGYSS